MLAIDHISQSGGVAPLVMPIFNGVSRFSRGEMIHKKFKKKIKIREKKQGETKGYVCASRVILLVWELTHNKKEEEEEEEWEEKRDPPWSAV